jgi:hypothetical protein
MNAGMATLLIVASVLILKKSKTRSEKVDYRYLIVSLIGYLIGVIYLKLPEERIHFVEYGILAFFLFRALRIDLPLVPSFVWAFVIASLIGWGDEGIQYLLPNRYYDNRDVLLNSISALLGLFFTAAFYLPKNDQKS